MTDKESKYEIMQLYPHTFDGHTLKRIRATKEFILNDGIYYVGIKKEEEIAVDDIKFNIVGGC